MRKIDTFFEKLPSNNRFDLGHHRQGGQKGCRNKDMRVLIFCISFFGNITFQKHTKTAIASWSNRK